jgi:hypothetical protein
MANLYCLQAANLYDALQEDAEAKRLKAGEIRRPLATEILRRQMASRRCAV